MPQLDKHDEPTTPRASPVFGSSRSHLLLYGTSVQQQPWWELAATAADMSSPSVSRSSSAKRRLFSLSCDDAAEEPLLPPFLAKPRPSHRQVAVTGVALLLLLALCGVDDLVAGDSSSNGHGLLQHTRRYLLADTGEVAAATSAAPPGSGVAAPATSLAADSAVITTLAALGWRSSQQPLWNVSFSASFLCPGRHDAAAGAVPEAAVRADFVSHLMPVTSLLAGSPTVATVVSWQPRAAGSSSSSRRDCHTATVSLLLPQQPCLALAAALEADPLLLLGPNSSGKDGREAAVWVSHLCCKAASCDQLESAEAQLSLLMGCTPGTSTQ